MDPASERPSVADSKRSHTASRIPHAATGQTRQKGKIVNQSVHKNIDKEHGLEATAYLPSAGPRNAAKKVRASH